jgi:hypothetical protein
MPNNQLSQFDLVEIITAKNVKWLHAPAGSLPKPGGVWSFVGIVENEALICKDGITCKIPLGDVRKVGEYRLPTVVLTGNNRQTNQEKHGKEK